MMEIQIMPDRFFAVTVISRLLICFFLTAGPGLASEGDYAVLVSPKTISPGKTFRVMVASETRNTKAMLKAEGPSGSLAMLKQHHGGGPPYWWAAEFEAKGEGINHLCFNVPDVQSETDKLLDKG